MTMKLHEVNAPTTVGELRKLLADLPDDMEVAKVQSGELFPLKLSIQVRGKGKKRLVSRGGVQFLAAFLNW